MEWRLSKLVALAVLNIHLCMSRCLVLSRC